MKIYSSTQGKGGVGKTTMSIGFSMHVARHDKRVLLIDLDSQANSTGSFISLDMASELTNTYDLIKGRPVTPINVFPGIDLLPASLDLLTVDKEQDIDLYFSFGENVRKQFTDRYDVVVIDTPGNLGTRVIAALVACDVAFSPSQPNKYSHQALEDLLKLVKKTRQRLNPEMIYAGVVMNTVKGITDQGEATQIEERSLINDFTAEHPDYLLGLVGQRAVIRDSFSNGQWLPNDEPGQKAAAEIARFSDKLMKIGGLV